MKKYHLYYHYKLCGDVLMIIFDYQSIFTHYKQINDVYLIFNDDKLIGINIFNFKQIVKIVAEGLLLNPPQQLIDILNDYFANQAIDVYLPKFQPSYLVGQVRQIDYLNGLNVALINTGLNQGYALIDKIDEVTILEKYVIIINQSILNDGTYFQSYQVDGIKILFKLADKFNDLSDDDESYIKLEKDAIIGSYYC